MFLTEVLPQFAIALVLLTYVTVSNRLGVRVPGWVFLVGGLAGVVHLGVEFGIATAAVSAGAALFALVFLVGVAARYVSGVGIFTITTSLAVLPWWTWWTLAVGIGFALIVSLFHIRRKFGSERVTYVAAETMQAFGVNPVGVVSKPDLDRIPIAAKDEGESQTIASPDGETEFEDEVDATVEVESSREPSIRIPEVLLGGVLVGLAVTSFLVLR